MPQNDHSSHRMEALFRRARFLSTAVVGWPSKQTGILWRRGSWCLQPVVLLHGGRACNFEMSEVQGKQQSEVSRSSEAPCAQEVT